MNNMKKFLAAYFITFLCLSFATANAQIIEFTGVDYSYIKPDDKKTPLDTKILAKNLAIKNAKEKAGVYLRSMLKSEKLNFTDDAITAIIDDAIKLAAVSYHTSLSSNKEIVIKAEVKVRVDSNEMLKKWSELSEKERKTLITQSKVSQQVEAENNKKIADIRKNVAIENKKSDNNIIEFNATGEYGYSYNDNEKTYRQEALADAMNLVLLQAGVYIESYSEAKKFKLTKDSTKIISAAIVKIKGKPHYDVDTEHRICYANITAVVDNSNLEQSIKKRLNK